MADCKSLNFNDLEFLEEIGHGNYGIVYRGKYLGSVVAIKKLIANEKYTLREKEMMSLSHPNCVQFLGSAVKDGDVYLVTEYIKGGDLGKLAKESQKLSWPKKVDIILDIARAVTYLHGKGYIHRDLKPTNLLINVEAGWKVKVCDFGFARTVDRNRPMTMLGTDEYMAPEIVFSEPYDEKADVFSFGIILSELVSGLTSRKRSVVTLFEFDVASFQAACPPDMPPELFELTILCTKTTPAERPAMADVLKGLEELREKWPGGNNAVGASAPGQTKKVQRGKVLERLEPYLTTHPDNYADVKIPVARLDALFTGDVQKPLQKADANKGLIDLLTACVEDSGNATDLETHLLKLIALDCSVNKRKGVSQDLKDQIDKAVRTVRVRYLSLLQG